jgi:hypothetical protein
MIAWLHAVEAGYFEVAQADIVPPLVERNIDRQRPLEVPREAVQRSEPFGTNGFLIRTIDLPIPGRG